MRNHFRMVIILAVLGGLIFTMPALTASAQVVYTQPQINKQFANLSITPGSVTQLTVSIYNDNTFGLINADWTDTMPAEIRIANPPNIVNTCGGSVSAPAGSNTFSLTGGSVPAKPDISHPGECSVTINVTSTTAGNHINTIPAGGLTANDAPTGSIDLASEDPASATLQVNLVESPTLTKIFNPTTVWAGETSTLTIRITNNEPTSGGVNLTQTTLTDHLPTNVVVATPLTYTLSPSCGGSASLTAVAGSGTITLNSGTIAPQATCNIQVEVVSSVQGVYTNTIPAGPLGSGSIQTLQGVTNTTPASADLNVQAIDILKDITPGRIPAGGVSTVTLTLRNPTATAYTGVHLTDNLPAGMTVYGTPATPQCGGVITSTATSVTLTGGTIPASSSPPALSTCTITFQVTTPINAPDETLVNEIPAGALTTDQHISNPSPVSDSLDVRAALTVSKVFSPDIISIGGTSTVTITLTNRTAAALTNVNFTDSLPTGLTVSGTPATPQCGGGITSTATSVTLTNGTVPAAPVPPTTPGTCTIVFQVTSSTAGTYDNMISAGDVTTGSGVDNGEDVGDEIIVVSGTLPVEVTKSFQTSPIQPGQTSRLRIRITAPADTDLSGLTISDTLPGALVIAATPAPVTTCTPAGLGAPIGGKTIALTAPGANLLAGASCTITVYVTSDTQEVVENIIYPNAVFTNESRTNTDPASDWIEVTGFTVGKAFSPTIVIPNGISRLTITLTNTALSRLVNVTLDDTLPGNLTNGVVVAATPNTLSTCGGTVTFPTQKTIHLAGGIIPASDGVVAGSCTVSVDVQGRGALATYTNTIDRRDVTGTVESSGEGIYALNDASADLEVGNLSVRVNKGFNPKLVYGGATSVLSVELNNPNAIDLTGVAFDDAMPTGMILATPPNFNEGSCGGVLTGSGNSFSFSGGTIPANSICTLTMNVTMTVTGNLTNSIAAGALTTANGVSNPDPADATLTNLSGTSVEKGFAPNPIYTGSGNYSILTITIRNTSGVDLTGMGLTDNLPGTLPNGLQIAGPPAPTPSTDCTGGTLTALAGMQQIELSGASLADGNFCTITVPVNSTIASNYKNEIPNNTVISDQHVTNPLPTEDTLIVLSTTAALGDYVWLDVDRDGIQDAGESGIPGVTVNLYDSTNTLIETMATDANGLYLFDDLNPGDYHVGFVPPAGYSFSPQDQGVNDAVDSDANVTTGQTVVTTLTAGETDLTWDAGLYTTAPTPTYTPTNTATSTSTNTPTHTPTYTPTFTVGPLADLMITKTNGSTSIISGEETIYTIRVTNKGPNGVTGAILRDDIAAGLVKTTVKCSLTPGQCKTPPTVTQLESNSFALPAINAGQYYEIDVTAIVTATSGSVTNVAVVTSPPGTTDPTPNDNTDADTDSLPAPLATNIPDTGFAPGRVSLLPEQPESKVYAKLADIWLEIPSLGIRASIVGVPLVSGEWDVSWLGRQAGWLNGTAYPSSTGNSVITGHVYLPNGKAGPFVYLRTLKWGDQVIIHSPDGQRYIYEVREVKRVLPNDGSIFHHEDRSWVTLVTCQGYNETTNTYKYRTVVRAVLMRVVTDTANALR
jgi:LPXTG-site transpeptidase (sortase) family protein